MIWQDFFQSDPFTRLPLYILLALAAEVFFTAVCDLVNPHYLCSWNVHGGEKISSVKPRWAYPGRDPRAVGYTFLWMIPIYGGIIFLEPIHTLIRSWPWFFRGLIYLALIWLAEFVSGWIIKKISGKCPWDYSYSRYSFKGYIRWDYALNWFLFGLIFEFFHDRFLLLTPALRAAFFAS